jgi:hypothetical protein
MTIETPTTRPPLRNARDRPEEQRHPRVLVEDRMLKVMVGRDRETGQTKHLETAAWEDDDGNDAVVSVKLDCDAGAAYLRLSTNRVARTVEFSEDIYVDLDPRNLESVERSYGR